MTRACVQSRVRAAVPGRARISLGALLLTLAVGALATATPAPSSGSGLVAAYSFNQGSGTSLADVSGNGNGGAISGATWTTAGRYGGALSFDGIDDWVTIADAAGLDLTARLTLEAWVRPAQLNWPQVVVKEQPGDIVYGLYAGSDRGPVGIVYIGGEIHTKAPSPLPANSWSHLAFTYDGARAAVYVNGVEVAARAVTGTMPNSTGPVRIGGNSIWGEWFSGQIDELRIYDRALTGGEIQTDMSTPLADPDTEPPSAPTGLVETAATQDSISIAWNASTDNVGVTGYGLYRDGALTGTTGTTGHTYSGLVCGTAYALAVDAFDAAGNRSAKAGLTAATSACPSGLVAAYSFDEGAADVSGNGHDGAISGATWTTAGRYGGALSFDGVNDWVTIADAPALDLSTQMTLEAWVRPAQVNWPQVIVKEQPGDIVYGLYAGSDGGPLGIVYIGGEVHTKAPSPLPLNSWSHLAVTYDGARAAVYVNGAEVAARAVTGAMPNSTGAVRIGGNSIWGEWFSGQIDELRIYSHSLTPAAIQTDMNTPLGEPDPEPSPPPTGASRFVSTTGSDANSCTQTAPCLTFNRAYKAALPGQIVEVAGGTYGTQRIEPDATKTSADDVVFQPAPGATVSVSYGNLAGGVTVYGASHLTIKGMKVGKLNVLPNMTCCSVQATTRFPDDVTFAGMTVNAMSIRNAANVRVEGSTLGDYSASDSYPNDFGVVVNVGSWISSSSTPAVQSRNVTFHGNLFHKLIRPAGVNKHTACFYSEGVTTNLTLTRNRFTKCAIIDFENAPETWLSPSQTLDGLLIENNWFDIPTGNIQTIGLMTGGGVSPSHVGKNWTIRHNSIKGAITIGNASYSNVVIAHNVWEKGGNPCVTRAGVTYHRNVIDTAKCGTSDTVAPAGWVSSTGFDFHLTPGAAAIDHADPANHPSHDIDGEARPKGVAPDAGADEHS